MQYKFTFIVLILGWISVLVGCSKGGATCDTGLTPKIRSNGPVGTNQTLELSLYGVSGVKSYSWNGPGNFSSSDQAPKISTPPRGTWVYSLTVTTESGCTYTGYSDSITISGPANFCGLDSNNAKLDGVVAMSFKKVLGYTGEYNYTIECSSASASVTVQFPKNLPPAEGTYSISSGTGSLDNDKTCHVNMKAITTSPWYATTGTVYVSVDKNVTTVSFCDIEFTCADYPTPVKGGARVVWQP
jgi:hypothetical protein